MIDFPNAKINLGLRVIRKRTDGFHDIETVFYPVSLCDILEIIESEGDRRVEEKNYLNFEQTINEVVLPSGKRINYSSSGIGVDGDVSQNLCIKAVKLYDQHVGLPFNLSMHLHKIIPMGAGLGGGSSDAASVLKIVNQLNGNKGTPDELLEMAGKLGSDCAFFMLNKPAFAEGKGEILNPIDVDLKGFELLIVKPPIHVSTAEAYSSVLPKEAHNDLIDAIRQSPDSWQNEILNDFETSVFKLFPEIETIKVKMQQSGAVYTSMSGSGSSVFGVFRNQVPDPSQFPGCFYFTKGL